MIDTRIICFVLLLICPRNYETDIANTTVNLNCWDSLPTLRNFDAGTPHRLMLKSDFNIEWMLKSNFKPSKAENLEKLIFTKCL